MIKGGYSATQIGTILKAKQIGRPNKEPTISYLLTDSRQIRFADQSLFFALIGPQHDGHQFLQQAYREGIRHFVVSHIPPDWPFQDGLLFLVEDTLEALQELARFHRQQFQLPLVGITGSNGKTSVKEWLFQILQDEYYVIRSPRSYNSQIGVPLSVWPLRGEHQLGIFEAGISQVGEMEKLERIIQPTIGLFTNLGSAHDAGFTSRHQKLQEKLKLFKNVEVIVYQSTGSEIDQAVGKLNRPVFTWSFDQPADVSLIQVEQDRGKSVLHALFKGQSIQIEIPFVDQAAIENAMHCWAICLYLGVAPEKLRTLLGRLTPIAMRLELQQGRNGCTLINDSYNSDLQSLSIALDFAFQQRGSTKLSLILSDILQSGMPADQLYREVAQLINQRKVARVIGVGQMIDRLEKFLPPITAQRYFPDTPSLIQDLDQFHFENETILIKGARPFAFEEVAQRLMPQTHRTVLEVNLSALAHNLRVFRTLLRPETRMMVMVKAAAYGGGSAEIARLLHFHGIQYLAVAYVDEGVELRLAGITLPIMVLNPEPVTFETMLKYQLEPEVYSLDQFSALAELTRSKGASLPIHLKLDTGMHRLGFMKSDLTALSKLLKEHPQLQVASIFSHLAAAEDPKEDLFTHQQAHSFHALYEKITETLCYRPLRHLLNSSGIARFPQYQMDMVRLGIGMYGIEACFELRGQLQTAFRLRSRISQIRSVSAGETVGYNRKDASEHTRTIATVSIGYADGLLRKAGNGRYAFRLRDQAALTVGNICMDMCMIDVSHIPNAAEGDEVIIFDDKLPIERLAGVYDTIPYEVLTSISSRVKRIYVME